VQGTLKDDQVVALLLRSADGKEERLFRIPGSREKEDREENQWETKSSIVHWKKTYCIVKAIHRGWLMPLTNISTSTFLSFSFFSTLGPIRSFPSFCSGSFSRKRQCAFSVLLIKTFSPSLTIAHSLFCAVQFPYPHFNQLQM